MERLRELAELWKRGSGPLGPEYLSYVLCYNLGRLLRVVESARINSEITKNKRSSMAGNIPRTIREIRAVEAMLRNDTRITRLALGIDPAWPLQTIKELISENAVISRFADGDVDPSDEAFRTLIALDHHLLALKAIGYLSVTPASRSLLRTHRRAMKMVCRLVQRHPEGFLHCQIEMREYCKNGRVGPESPLYAIGFPSWKTLREYRRLAQLIRA